MTMSRIALTFVFWPWMPLAAAGAEPFEVRGWDLERSEFNAEMRKRILSE